MIRVALAGTGGISSVHLASYRLMNDVELVAVADIDTDKAQRKVWPGIKIFGDVDEMLKNEKIDLLDICLPTFLHAQYSIKAMDRGINVLCEKPAAINYDEAYKMLEASKRNNVSLMIAHVLRFWPEYQYLKEVYSSKIFGDLSEAVFYRYSPKATWSWNDWLLKKELGGFAPLDLHIHDVDFVLFLFGIPVSIYSTGVENEYSDTIETHYDFGNRMVVRSEGGWFNGSIPFSAGYRAVFDKAIVEYKNHKLIIYEYGKEPYEKIVRNVDLNNTNTGINVNDFLPYYNEIMYITECIKNKTHPEACLPEESIKTIDVVFKEIESREKYEKIYL